MTWSGMAWTVSSTPGGGRKRPSPRSSPGERGRALLRGGDGVGQPVEAEVAQAGPGRVAGAGIAARELVVRLARALELLGGHGDARGGAFAPERREELLGQHVLVLPDALAGVEGAQEVDAPLAGLDELVERGVPAGAVADELHRLGGPIELPRRPPHELAEAERVERRVE